MYVCMLPPTDKQGVTHFCGMVTYLNTFCPIVTSDFRTLVTSLKASV